MADNKPNYPLLRPQDMSPRDEMELVPEDELDPFWRAEIHNLRKGTGYYFTIGDTPQNRENFNMKAMYFQMVAYKEGWGFDPEKLQVKYIPPGDPRFPQDNSEYRVAMFEEGAKNFDFGLEHPLSDEGRLGFRFPKNKGPITQLKPDEADDLGAKVIKLFP